MTSDAPLIEMRGITKRFGAVVANDNVELRVDAGIIHAVIGENGAGKSTLIGILYGRYEPDTGTILLRGRQVAIRRPADAIRLGIGMVSQHTTMIPALTVLENIVLGAEPGAAGLLSRSQARHRIDQLAREVGVDVPLERPAEALSVAALQKAEILKALYRGARILVLDEPTSTLAPPEADALFALLHRLVEAGSTVLFITHKLREVMAHSSAVTVLRGGRVTGRRVTAETDQDELLQLMLGRTAPASPELAPAAAIVHPTAGAESPATRTGGAAALEVRGVTVAGDRGAPAVRSVSLAVQPGEILGVAGVDGSGQRELAEAIVGLRPLAAGSVLLYGAPLDRLPVARRAALGVAYVPEDRLRDGLILSFNVADNLLLGRECDPRAGGGLMLRPQRIVRDAVAALRDNGIRAAGPLAPAGSLSGGNQQKLVLARALAGHRAAPRVLVAMQPTRGLDVQAARFVYARIRERLAQGMAVLLFSLDLDEVLEQSDRVAVMYNGEIAAVLSRAEATPERVGELMVGAAA